MAEGKEQNIQIQNQPDEIGILVGAEMVGKDDSVVDQYQDWSQMDRMVSIISEKKSYNCYDLKYLINRIYQQNNQQCSLTQLEPDWNLMLYYFCDFSQQRLSDLLDQQQTGRKIIEYNKNYKPYIIFGECLVCFSTAELISNTCGHAFCIDCWKQYLKIHHYDRKNSFDLFPKCQADGCCHKANIILMEHVWNCFPEMRQHFDKLLCLKYTKKSKNVKLCSGQGCNKAIFIDFIEDSVLICDCGNKICKFCGQSDHFPLNCGDLLAWNRIAINQQIQWIQEIVIKKCPRCKTSIDKNYGCLHMTCQCKFEFCWACLSIWQGHMNGFYRCPFGNQLDQELRLLQQQQKRLEDKTQYLLRFQTTKSQTERFTNMISRLKLTPVQNFQNTLRLNYILKDDLISLTKIRDTIVKAFQMCIYINIYAFFQLQGFLFLEKWLERLNHQASNMDDNLTRFIQLAKQVYEQEEQCKEQQRSINQTMIQRFNKTFKRQKQSCFYRFQNAYKIIMIKQEIKNLLKLAKQIHDNLIPLIEKYKIDIILQYSMLSKNIHTDAT